MTTEDLLVATLKTFLKDVTEHLDRIELSLTDLKATLHGVRLDMFTKITDVNKQVQALDTKLNEEPAAQIRMIDVTLQDIRNILNRLSWGAPAGLKKGRKK